MSEARHRCDLCNCTLSHNNKGGRCPDCRQTHGRKQKSALKQAYEAHRAPRVARMAERAALGLPLFEEG